MPTRDSGKKEKSKKGRPKRLVLLDAHAILHRAYHALPDFATSKGEPTGALYGLSAMLIKIIADLKPDYLIAAYDLPKPTYRHEAYKEYKAGRVKATDELVSQMKRSREIFEAFGIPIYDKEGFEADDVIGTIVEQIVKDKGLRVKDSLVDIIIASGDMDTLQLVNDKKVRVYTLKKGINDTILYDEDEVRRRFGFGPELLPDYKGLRGDTSDNIIGIKGIGEKTATTLIQTFGSIEEMYKQLKKGTGAFEKAGIKPRMIELLEKGKEEAEFSKMLGTIRTDAPIDFKLPEHIWREEVDEEKVKKLFAELEFRGLPARFHAVFTGAEEQEKEKGEEENTLPFANTDPQELQETSIALWLLNSSITRPTLEDILAFSRTETFAEARKKLLLEIKEKGLTRVFEEIEKPLIPIVKKMEERGVKIDIELLQRMGKEYHRVLGELAEKIHDLAGQEFNISSPKQLGEILFVKLGLARKRAKKTPTGALSTKESELEKLRDTHAIIPLILEYRELSKLLSTYIDNLPQLVGNDGRLHAKFLQAGTTTGRMSSEEPNLQNIPNQTDLGRAIRLAFVAEKGYKLLAFDYSQMELRIAAFISGDQKLIQIFKDGLDVHAAVAAEVFGVPLEQITKEMRRQAKVINFGVMYGMGVNSLRQALGQGGLQVTLEEARKFYDGYFQKFSGLATYLNEIKTTALLSGFTETFFGRRRYHDGLKSPLPYIRAAAERMAINAPMQGTGADIIKIAMVHADAWIQQEKLEKKVFLLLQVHDELVYEVKTELIDTVVPKIKSSMETVLSRKDTSGVPIVVDASVGDNWGEMVKIESSK